MASQTAASTPVASNGEGISTPPNSEGTPQPNADAGGELTPRQVIHQTPPSSWEVGTPRTLTFEQSPTSQRRRPHDDQPEEPQPEAETLTGTQDYPVGAPARMQTPTPLELFSDAEVDGLTQTGWDTRIPGLPPPPSPGGSTASFHSLHEEGGSPGRTTFEDEPQGEVAIARGRFISKWKESFLGCHRGNLDQMMEEFARELLTLSNKPPSRPPVALIKNKNEISYRSEVSKFVQWCNTNYLQLNVNKTKEMVIDF